jgi:hypothetical protein
MNAEELLVTIAVAIVASQLMMLELRLLPTVITTALARQSTIRVETAPVVKLARELIMPKMHVVSMSLVWVRPLGWNFLRFFNSSYSLYPGICGGDNSSCLGCDGVPNSGKTIDSCGVCGGDGSSCTAISAVMPSLLPTTSSSGRVVTVHGAGLNGDAIKCILDGEESQGR